MPSAECRRLLPLPPLVASTPRTLSFFLRSLQKNQYLKLKVKKVNLQTCRMLCLGSIDPLFSHSFSAAQILYQTSIAILPPTSMLPFHHSLLQKGLQN
ncbi:uncharacterized protein LOC107762467 isoform X4 [Nicotiana tabacum]|uniref:Uncharacterized protein LOC107762467 isoform X4 n=1 Tax=Nicotiana tabacum TaxID=4097 RepID=A0AC58T6R6_TOBAC